jgi:large subunit ribosomal protein L25
MSDAFEVQAEIREDKGKGASRRLRRLADKIPAILYGGTGEPKSLTLIRKDLEHALENEAFYSHIITIDVSGSKEKAILKDLQRHPARNQVMHADFLRVSDDVKVKMNVPIHFNNEDLCHGVKMEGGIIQHSVTEIEVQCLPADIPEYVEVDMLDVMVGDILHITDIKLPEGVESVALAHGTDHDLAIASIAAPKGIGTAEDEEAAPEAESEAEEGESEE